MENLTEKIKELPDWVKDKMEREQSSNANRQIGEKYNLDQSDRIGEMVHLIVKTIVKDIALENFLKALKDKFSDLDQATVQKMALDIAKKRFWPLREWLSGTEKLIKDLGGELPKEGPKGWQETKLNEAKSEPKAPPDSQKEKKREEPKKAFKPPQNLPGQENTEAQKKTADEPAGSIKADKQTKKAGETKDKKQARLVKKPIRKLQKKFPQVKDQPLTSEPLELQDMEGDVRPTVKNWLKDYRFRMGAGYHDNMQRRSYLFRTKNGEKLDKTERKIISELLKSADEREPLPFDPETKKIVISKLVSKGEELSKKEKKSQPDRGKNQDSQEKRESLLGKNRKDDAPPGFEKVQEDKKQQKQKEDNSQAPPSKDKPDPNPNGKTVDLSK